MIGTRVKPKGVKSYSYKKILFDKQSENFYATQQQLADYRENDVDKIIQDHQDGITTLKHELAIAELVSISYYCWFGRQPTCRIGGNGKFPYVYKKYHTLYQDEWLAVVMRLLNSFKVGRGSWYSYVVFAKRDGLRGVKNKTKKEKEYNEMLDEFEVYMGSCHQVHQNNWLKEFPKFN